MCNSRSMGSGNLYHHASCNLKERIEEEGSKLVAVVAVSVAFLVVVDQPVTVRDRVCLSFFLLLFLPVVLKNQE